MKTELFTRLQSETPKWFKRIRNTALVVSAMAGAIQAGAATIENFKLTEKQVQILNYCIVAGMAAAATSTTAKETK